MGYTEKLLDRPDLFLVVVLFAFMMFALLLAIVAAFASGGWRTRLIREIITNPGIQERLKDPQVNIVELVDRLAERAERADNGPRRGLVGILEKINQDISWDVAGLIGMIVTVVLMALIVTQKQELIPKEVFAGWSVILGFYFGKAARR
jgi:hypothetical protein